MPRSGGITRRRGHFKHPHRCDELLVDISALLVGARRSTDLNRVGDCRMATPVASLSEGPDYMNDHKILNDHRMMTVKEVADYLGIASSTVYRLTERGALPALKVGSGWRFNSRMIDKWRFNLERGPMDQVTEKRRAPVHSTFRVT